MGQIMPDTTGPLAVALVYDGLCTFEFGVAAEVFGLDRPEMGPGWYRFASCGIGDGPLRAHGGLTITPDHGPELIEEADIIVVPGWKGADHPVPEALCAALRRAHARGARLVSICSGAFVLAATGLLDGGDATTHWRYADKLGQRHPGIAVDARSLYRGRDGIWTSAGSAAGIDLLIEIVRQDFGAAAANSVARRLVVPAHRSGGQAQFLERPVPARASGEIAPLLDRIRERPDAPWTSERMAGEVRMSLRTFLRRFQEATGTTPGEWLTDERIEAAKALLCEADLSIETVAGAVGFGSAHALRHHFRNRIGLTPTEYRTRFLAEGRGTAA
ncbi:transcriptional regulator [Pseudooceanicola atlanticus]|uniref:Transcriptional regulator n=2 Tax=Pseudooceanicola atlanticus TaxID=1461694 RepID=A0A0A0EGS1_9RHOB|nr:transcriptional regulator [Pseudooceanicola atlanticus]